MTTGRGAQGSVLALVGLRCVGKTSVGRALAERVSARFIDLDDELAAEWVARVPPGASSGTAASPPAGAGELLAREGLAAFRALELGALRRVLTAAGSGRSGGDAVLATGGGCVETPEVRELLVAHATTVWLRENPAVLAERLRADPRARPSLTGRDPGEELVALARVRGPLYAEVADVTLDGQGGDAADLVERLLAELPAPWRIAGA